MEEHRWEVFNGLARNTSFQLLLYWLSLSHRGTGKCNVDVTREETRFVGQIATHVISFNPHNDAEAGHPPHFTDKETEAWRG